jgi:hypothetical protein
MATTTDVALRNAQFLGQPIVEEVPNPRPAGVCRSFQPVFDIRSQEFAMRSALFRAVASKLINAI